MRTLSPIPPRLAGALAAVLLAACGAAVASATVRVDTLYATAPVPGVHADWQNAGALTGPPPGNCNTNVATPYAFNDNDASSEYLAFGTWRTEQGAPFTQQPGLAISRVYVDVDGRYDDLSTGDRFGLRVLGTLPQTDLLTPAYDQAGFSCSWQLTGMGWDVTALQPHAWRESDVRGLLVAARRYPGSDPVPPNRARIGAFRLIVTSTDGVPLPAGGTLTMTFTTGEGGHAGSADVNVNIGTISVAGGLALMNSGQVLQVDVRNAPSPGPVPIVRGIHLGLDAQGNPPLGFGSCGPDGATMVLLGPTKESVLAIDANGVPRNVSVDGVTTYEITDGGAADRVRVFFTPADDDPDLWAAVAGLVFDVPITRGTVTASGCPTTGVDDGARAIPRDLFLDAPAPNPVAGPATLSFGLPRAGRVSLDVFDVRGRRVATLARGEFAAGRYARTWDGLDRDGGRRSPGIYFVRLVTQAGARTQRLTLIR